MLLRILLVLCASLMMSRAPVAAHPMTDAEVSAARAEILKVVEDMQAAWNRGDFRGYMAGFKNPEVVFVSGGRIKDGWQGALDDYVRNYGASDATRGTLTFYDMKIELLAPDAAQLIGHYRLDRPEKPMEGINTRLFRKVNGRWVIALNHVSAYEVKR